MSDTFMDERYRQNADRAQLTALKIFFKITFFALVILCQGRILGNTEYSLIAVIIVLSLGIGLTIFLSEYLLYRYDYDEALDGSEE